MEIERHFLIMDILFGFQAICCIALVVLFVMMVRIEFKRGRDAD